MKQFIAYVAASMLVALSLGLAACGNPQNTVEQNNRLKYAQTLKTATTAYQTVDALVDQGVIKPGSAVALEINDARAALTSAMKVWRRDPDNISYANMGMAALPPLLSLIEKVSGKKITALEPRRPSWAPSKPFSPIYRSQFA